MNKRINRLLLLLPAMLIAGAVQAQADDSVLKGDANGDGQVTIADVVAVENVLHGSTPAGFNAAAADVNGDGQITIADVVGIENIIHYGTIDAETTIHDWEEGSTSGDLQPADSGD